MKTFTKFITENLEITSQYSDLISEFVNGMRQADWMGANISVNLDNSIEIESDWELDTMKISGFGKIEPSAYFTMVLQPKFNNASPEKLARLVQLGLSNLASLLEGFTITTSLLVQDYEVDNYQFSDGPDTQEYSLEDLDIDHFFKNNDLNEAGLSFMEWWQETANQYGYGLDDRVKADLEKYAINNQSDDSDEDTDNAE